MYDVSRIVLGKNGETAHEDEDGELVGVSLGEKVVDVGEHVLLAVVGLQLWIFQQVRERLHRFFR